MNPDYRTAKRSAIETVIHLGDDPKAVLLKMRNVLLLSYDSENPDPMQTGQDSYTVVNRKDDVLQYIIVYNQELAPEHKRFTLARELAHVILQHDGTSPEAVWAEEADYFAFYYINPLQIIQKFSVEKIVPGKIKFRPKRTLSLWEFKTTMAFNSIDDMKSYVIDESGIPRSFVKEMRNTYPLGENQMKILQAFLKSREKLPTGEAEEDNMAMRKYPDELYKVCEEGEKTATLYDAMEVSDYFYSLDDLVNKAKEGVQ
jgi:hypothetical protein